MEKPKEKYWKVTRQEIGTELGNPNYIQWADEEIKKLSDRASKSEIERGLLQKVLDWRGLDGDGITDPLRQEVMSALKNQATEQVSVADLRAVDSSFVTVKKCCHICTHDKHGSGSLQCASCKDMSEFALSIYVTEQSA